MPKFSSAYQMSILSRSRKYPKQSPGEIDGTRTRAIEWGQRQVSNSNALLATDSMGPSVDLSLDVEDEALSHESNMIGIHV